MSSSLIPERPLVVSPSLAATIGLEEATMLSVLSDLTRSVKAHPHQGYGWYQLLSDTLLEAFPFWDVMAIERVSQSLRAKGVLLLHSAPFSESQKLVFAFNEADVLVSTMPQPTQPTQPTQPYNQPNTQPAQPIRAVGATPIAPNWQPDSETIARIAQHNIDVGFIHQQVPEFVTYWRDSGESQRSWGSKFHQHVVHQWRQRETFSAQKNKEMAISAGWKPSADALDVLVRHAGINPQFVEDAIPEFVLYWGERGEKASTWNSKFIQHVRRQWARYTSALEHDTEPKRISEDWQPSADVYDILRMANIDAAFAQQLVPEFIIYWRDSNQLYASWNTKFLQHVKHHWAKRHALANSQGLNHDQQANTSRTRDRSLADDLNDRSWAV